MDFSDDDADAYNKLCEWVDRLQVDNNVFAFLSDTDLSAIAYAGRKKAKVGEDLF